MKQKKRILFINGHLNVGGVEKSLVDLLNWMDYNIYDVDLLLLEDKGDYYQQLPPQVNVIYKRISEAYGPFISIIRKNLKNKKYTNILFRIIIILSSFLSSKLLILLRPILNNNKYDCAIAYRTGFCTDILVYTIKSNCKIAWWHHGFCDFTQEQIINTNKTWKHLNYLITVSQGCKDMLQKTFSFPPNKLHVIPNLIDIVKINKLAGEDSPFKNQTNQYNLVTVGRISPEKQIDSVITITKELINNNIMNFKWHIIGDGELYNIIYCKIKENKLDQYIQMHGKKENPYPFIKYSDLLIHTSLVESQCLTVLEAMALKTPCIVRESIGPKEFIKTGHNGFLINGDSAKFASVIKLLMQDIETKQKITKEAYHTVTTLYNARCIIDQFKNICLKDI